MKSKALRLFIISTFILLGTFLFSVFRTNFGIEANYTVGGAMATIAFGLSIAGMIIGLGEVRNLKTRKTWIGLIGNIVIVGLFILIVFYVS